MDKRARSPVRLKPLVDDYLSLTFHELNSRARIPKLRCAPEARRGTIAEGSILPNQPPIVTREGVSAVRGLACWFWNVPAPDRVVAQPGGRAFRAISGLRTRDSPGIGPQHATQRLRRYAGLSRRREAISFSPADAKPLSLSWWSMTASRLVHRNCCRSRFGWPAPLADLRYRPCA
jgi:hypothetical protein